MNWRWRHFHNSCSLRGCAAGRPLLGLPLEFQVCEAKESSEEPSLQGVCYFSLGSEPDSPNRLSKQRAADVRIVSLPVTVGTVDSFIRRGLGGIAIPHQVDREPQQPLCAPQAGFGPPPWRRGRGSKEGIYTEMHLPVFA